MTDQVPEQGDARKKLAEFAARMDGWTNVLTALGVEGKDHRLASNYQRRPSDIDREEIEAMYEQDALFARMVDGRPEHATRRWINVSASRDDDGVADEDLGKATMNELDELDVQGAAFEALRLEELFGGSAIVIGADDNAKPAAPLDLENVRKLRFLNVVDRWELFPAGTRNLDPLSPFFQQFEFYTFAAGTNSTGAIYAGGGKIHRSRLIIFRGIVTSHRTQMRRLGWGVPRAERTYEALRRFYSILGYAEAAFKDIVQGVLKLKGLADMIAGDAEKNELAIKRIQTLMMCASAFNAIVLDEDEDYERRTLALAGYSDMVLRSMDELCAVAEMPLSVLFGQAPTGLSTDDKSGRTTFYDSIANMQRRKLRKPLRRVLEVLYASKKGPTKGVMPASYDIEFRPLTEPTDQEIAETNASKASTTVALIREGVITADEARNSWARDPHSPFEIDTSLSAEDIQADKLDQQVLAQEALQPDDEGEPDDKSAPKTETDDE